MKTPFIPQFVSGIVIFHSISSGAQTCPSDMRRIQGRHYDEVAHICLQPDAGKKDTHCFAYAEGITAEEGTLTEINTCMDLFEAPNQRGAKPLVMQSFNAAKKWCAARNKRTCTEQEWEFACEGPEHRPLAYGWAVDRQLCNSGRSWKAFNATALYGKDEEAQKEVDRLWQGALSGNFKSCFSPFGVFDMMGNVEEWVATRSGRTFPGALMGGFWAKPWTGCRGTNDAHEPTFTFYETGFRCCADPTPSKP